MEDKIIEDLEQVDNIEDIEKKIKETETLMANSQLPHLNRAQRRAFKKKHKVKQNIISDTALKLNYIDLIQKLRELNKKKENNEDEGTNQDS